MSSIAYSANVLVAKVTILGTIPTLVAGFIP